MVKMHETTLLVVMMDNSKVFVYQDLNYFSEKDSERFRFKLIESAVLIKPTTPLRDAYSNKLIANDDLLIVLHSHKPFAISVRNGKVVLNEIGATGSSLVSLTPFMTGFLAIDHKQEAILLTRFPLGFDLRKHRKLADGVMLKQSVYVGKGIKLLKVFNPSLVPTSKEYLLLTTFQLSRPQASEPNQKVDNGFSADTKALVYHYKIEIYSMPKAGQWKEFS